MTALGRVFTGICFLLIAFIVLLGINIAVLVRAGDNAASAEKASVDNGEILQLIKDCTSVEESECQQRAEARTGEAVQGIGRIVIYAVSCAKVNDSDPAIENCVREKLAK